MKRSLMTVMRVATVMAILCLTVDGPARADYVETFDGVSTDWVYGYGSGGTWGTTTYNSTGGNSGSCISGLANVAGALTSVQTINPAIYGDLRGHALTVDTMITEHMVGDARFYVGRNNTFFGSSARWTILDDSVWSTHTVLLTDTSFSQDMGMGDATWTLDQVLEAPTYIGILFAGAATSGSGVMYVDNFGTVVPEPSTLALLGMGAMGLLGWAWRKPKAT